MTANNGSARFQLTGATDAISFGDYRFWPGSPTYSEVWSATGTSIGNFSETMNFAGFQFFDGTMSYDRPQTWGPAFGFGPTVAANVSQFQWWISERGWVPCLLLGDSIQMAIQ